MPPVQRRFAVDFLGGRSLGGQDGAEHRVRMKAVDASVLGARNRVSPNV